MAYEPHFCNEKDMLVIRYNRTGRRNAPMFRLVVQEKSVAPGGRHTEVVGSWNPHKKEGIFKNDRIKHWIAQGAQPSDSVHNLLVSQGIIEDKKRAVKMPTPEVKEEEAGGTTDSNTSSEVQSEGVGEQENEGDKEEVPSEEKEKEDKKA